MKRYALHSAALVAAFLVIGSGPASAQGQPPAGGAAPGGPPRPPPLLMTTTAFEDGGVIPDKYTQAGGPMSPSPELKWSQVPMGTQSFVLLMHDPEPVLNKGSKMDITH
jgi:phosphatidylethanolamine-binding protein